MLKSQRVYIIGFMGVGKTTLGKKLARRLGYSYIDTDKLLEHKYKISIDSFFLKYGEELFREFEYQCLTETFELKNCVVSTGGGLPCYYDAIERINENGTSVYLQMDAKAIYNRLINSKQKRPLVKNLSSNELLEYIIKKLDSRKEYYNQAHITVPGIDVDLGSLVSLLEKF